MNAFNGNIKSTAKEIVIVSLPQESDSNSLKINKCCKFPLKSSTNYADVSD